LPENETTAKAIGFLPTIIAILFLIALIFDLKLGKMVHLCKEVNFAQWELSVKFSSVTFRCFMASSLSSFAQASQI